MRLAIMQPYFFPYVGYFQLIDAVDKLVFYDDVSYSKNRWVNRNRIAVNGTPHYLTVPLANNSSSLPIHDLECAHNRHYWVGKMLKTIQHSYASAPYRDRGVNLVESVLSLDTNSVADIARQSVISVMNLLDMQRELEKTSRSYGNDTLTAEHRVLDICAREHAKVYVNLPGGRALYRPEPFQIRGLGLKFIEPRLSAYPQTSPGFIPALSILDMLMWCSLDSCKQLLMQYGLET